MGVQTKGDTLRILALKKKVLLKGPFPEYCFLTTHSFDIKSEER